MKHKGKKINTISHSLYFSFFLLRDSRLLSFVFFFFEWTLVSYLTSINIQLFCLWIIYLKMCYLESAGQQINWCRKVVELELWRLFCVAPRHRRTLRSCTNLFTWATRVVKFERCHMDTYTRVATRMSKPRNIILYLW